MGDQVAIGLYAAICHIMKYTKFFCITTSISESYDIVQGIQVLARRPYVGIVYSTLTAGAA